MPEWMTSPAPMIHHYLPPGESHHIDAAKIAGHYLSGARRFLMRWCVVTTAWLLLSTWSCWGEGCAFRRTSPCWIMTIWWALVSCFCRGYQRYSCRTMKLAASVHCTLSRGSSTGYCTGRQPLASARLNMINLTWLFYFRLCNTSRYYTHSLFCQKHCIDSIICNVTLNRCSS